MLGFYAICAGTAIAGGSTGQGVATSSHIGGRILGGYWSKGKWRTFVAAEIARQEQINRKKRQQALVSEQARIDGLGRLTPFQKALAAIEAESIARQKHVMVLARDNAIEARKAIIELAKRTQILSQMEAFARLRQVEEDEDDEEAIAFLLDD